MVNVAVPVPAALVALRDTVNTPALGGVPERTAPDLDSQDGRLVALKLVGLLLAVIV